MPDYHVATTGNDTTGDGSLALPWLSIKKALAVAAAASLSATYNCYLRAGTHDGPNLNTTVDQAFTGRFTIKPYPGETVVLRGDGANAGTFLFSGTAANITIDGSGGTLSFANNGASNTVHLWFANNTITGASGIQVKNCTMTQTNNASWCVLCSNHNSTNLLIDTCTMTCSGTGNADCIFIGGHTTNFHQGTTITGCTLKATRSPIRFTVAGRIKDLTVTNTTVWSTAATGIGCGSASAIPVSSNLSIGVITHASHAGSGVQIVGGIADHVIGVTFDSTNNINCLAAKTIGVDLTYCDSVTVNGGAYRGGEQIGGGGAKGGFWLIGGDNHTIANATFEGGNDLSGDDPTLGPLAMAFEDADNIVVEYCTFTGYGRGCCFQDNTNDAVVRYCDFDVSDQCIRCGHDGTPSYTTSGFWFHHNKLRAHSVAAVIIGLGVEDALVEDNEFLVGQTFVRIRSQAVDVIIRNNTGRSGLASTYDPSTADAAFHLFGALGTRIINNSLTVDSDCVFETALGGDGGTDKIAALVITGNHFTLRGATVVYDWEVAHDDGGHTIDNNTYSMRPNAWGSLNGATPATKAALLTAWGTNSDQHSAHATPAGMQEAGAIA